MDELENKVKKVKNANKKGGIIALIIAVVLVVIGIVSTPNKESWEEFDPMNSGEYSQTEIYYLIGPFAEYTEDGKVTENLYCALTTEEQFIVIKTGKNTDLPVWGEDVTEENEDSIEPVKAYGYSKELEEELAKFLIEFWNEGYEEEFLTMSNYDEYLGSCYLDTKDQGEGTSAVCYIFGAMAVIVGIVMLMSKRQSQNADNVINKLDDNRLLDDFRNEYTKDNIEEYKKIKVETTPNYLVSYYPTFTVIPFSDITNAYQSNMINGKYEGALRYIAVETKNNEKYYIAPKSLNQNNEQFDEVLQKIKGKIR